jgi:hypothetical protein
MKFSPLCVWGNQVRPSIKVWIGFSAAFVAASLAVLFWQFINLEPGLDMPWMPARLLGQGIDPYGAYLEPTSNNPQFLAQIPNMLHTTYVMFAPLGFMSWEWAKSIYSIINVVLAGVILVRVRSIFKLSNMEFSLVATLFVVSTPFRVTIYNGQFSLVALLGVTLFLERATITRAIGLGIALLKYSFAFPIAFLILLTKDIRNLLGLVLLPALFGMVVFHTIFQARSDYAIVSMVIAPLRVALVGTGLGASDLYSLFRSVVPEASNVTLLGILIAISIFGLLAAIRLRELDKWSQIALICLVTLTILPHLIYDYVFLLPVVAYAVVLRKTRLKWFIAPTVAWHWFLFGPFQTLSVLVKIPETISIVLGLAMNVLAVTGLMLMAKRDSATEHETSDHCN